MRLALTLELTLASHSNAWRSFRPKLTFDWKYVAIPSVSMKLLVEFFVKQPATKSLAIQLTIS